MDNCYQCWAISNPLPADMTLITVKFVAVKEQKRRGVNHDYCQWRADSAEDKPAPRIAHHETVTITLRVVPRRTGKSKCESRYH